MSENGFGDILNIIKDPSTDQTVQQTVNHGDVNTPSPNAESIIEEVKQEDKDQINQKMGPFNIANFAEELRIKSEEKNRLYAELSSSISGYSIASDCISTTVKKLLNYPVINFAHKWLPIMMRACIGSAIHDFIQENTSQMTELEKSLKVPSIRFSGRLDGLIGNNVLVEIKSCTYKDYAKILRDQRPRTADFYQAMTYKYVLENHLQEIKNPGVNTRTPPPLLDEYKIDTIQFIYVAHDIVGADFENLGQAMKVVDVVKKTLNSRRDQFYNMSSIVLDINLFDPTPYNDYIQKKINAINWYVNNNKLPTEDDEFVDKKKCFFCLYKDNCELL